ncbi:hypothetical protein [Streptomyces sp. NPDC056983]|uniref:hypothetical protein n=1 Tax=Streptomyces sp. NPDC056983 TaxID=3345987 RepID=UPI00362D9032
MTASWWQRKAEASYKVAEKELTPWRPWSLPALRREFNQVKRTDSRYADWWHENSKEAYSTGLANAAAAFDNYAKSKNGCRRGVRMGAPRFKSKRKARLACRFTTGSIRVADDRHVTLPVLGTIRTHEATVKLLARVQAARARIPSATVRHERGRWFVSFQTEVQREITRVARPGVAVGIDLGVKVLAVMADSAGEIRYVDNPKHHEEHAGDVEVFDHDGAVLSTHGGGELVQGVFAAHLQRPAQRLPHGRRLALVHFGGSRQIILPVAGPCTAGPWRRDTRRDRRRCTSECSPATRAAWSSTGTTRIGRHNRYRSGRRPGHAQRAETAWSRPEDPRQPGQPQS